MKEKTKENTPVYGLIFGVSVFILVCVHPDVLSFLSVLSGRTPKHEGFFSISSIECDRSFGLFVAVLLSRDDVSTCFSNSASTNCIVFESSSVCQKFRRLSQNDSKLSSFCVIVSSESVCVDMTEAFIGGAAGLLCNKPPLS